MPWRWGLVRPCRPSAAQPCVMSSGTARRLTQGLFGGWICFGENFPQSKHRLAYDYLGLILEKNERKALVTVLAAQT